MRFEERTLDDIRAIDDGRADEQAFATVAEVSEINEGLYDTFLRPWIQMWANPGVAEARRMMHPLRLQRWLVSDLNPMLWPIGALAPLVRENRHPAAGRRVPPDRCGMNRRRLAIAGGSVVEPPASSRWE